MDAEVERLPFSFDDFPATVRRALWREWADGRLRRLHSLSWRDYREAIDKKLVDRRWQQFIQPQIRALAIGFGLAANPGPLTHDEPKVEPAEPR